MNQIEKVARAMAEQANDYDADVLQWECWMDSAKAAIAAMTVQVEPVAVIRFARGTPGQENEMPKVISCNWMPDGEYPLYAHPPVPQWQGIESAPRDRGRTTIIAAWRCADSGQMQVSGDVNNIAGAWYSDSEGIIDPTHWMPTARIAVAQRANSISQRTASAPYPPPRSWVKGDAIKTRPNSRTSGNPAFLT